MIFTFKGLIAPVFTPFNKDGTEINFEIIPQYANYLLDIGIHGVLVSGTTGEGPSLCISERILLMERWASVCKTIKQTLMVQIGGAPMPEVVQMARLAADTKVDALLCLPDLYFKPSNTMDLIKYLSAVAKAAPNTPLLYYHIPGFTNVNINMAEFLTKASETNAIPTLAGIKFTSNDLNEGTACLRVDGGRYSVFVGADHVRSAACALGFDSAIATTLNFVPQYSQDIFEIFKSKERADVERVQQMQQKLSEIVNLITKYGSWVNSMKAAMNILSPIDVGPVREPLAQLTPEQLSNMRSEFVNIGLL